MYRACAKSAPQAQKHLITCLHSTFEFQNKMRVAIFVVIINPIRPKNHAREIKTTPLNDFYQHILKGKSH